MTNKKTTFFVIIVCSVLAACQKKAQTLSPGENEKPTERAVQHPVLTSTATAFHGFFERHQTSTITELNTSVAQSASVFLYKSAATSTFSPGSKLGNLSLNGRGLEYREANIFGQGSYFLTDDTKTEDEIWEDDGDDDMPRFHFANGGIWPQITNPGSIPDSIKVPAGIHFTLNVQGATWGTVRIGSTLAIFNTYTDSLREGNNAIDHDDLFYSAQDFKPLSILLKFCLNGKLPRHAAART